MHRESLPVGAPMRVCDVTMFYAAHGGGVRRYIEAKHDWLIGRTAVDHVVVAPRGRDGALVPYQRTLFAPPVPFSNGFRCPWRTGPWLALLEALRPDLIEAGDPYRLAWAAIEAGQRLGAAAVGFYHSDLPGLVAARFGAQARRVAERYVRHLYSHFDLVLVPSRIMQRRLHELGIARCRVQRLGVDAECFHPGRRSARLRRELGVAPGARLLVFAGRNVREKGLDNLVDAVGRLGSGYHLLLVGPQMVRSRRSNVTSISRFVDAPELAGILASSDALVHAGTAETFGLVVVEAMACGIPVVGVDAGAVPELIAPATGMLAQTNAPRHLAEAVDALFRRDVREMGRAARQAVESKLTWDRTFRGLLSTYEALAGRRSPHIHEGLIGAAG